MAFNKGLLFNPDLDSFFSSRENSFYTTFSGGNNSGKSLVLKNMKAALGKRAYMASPARFYHVSDLSTQRYDPNDYENFNNQFRSQLSNDEFNHEQNYIDLGRIISSLSDAKRVTLFEICGQLIGCTFQLKKRDPSNELSHRYIDVDGQSLAVASTGTRLLLTLIGLCLDSQFEVMLVDEPELGLSPRVQTALANFFMQSASREKHFSHLKGIFVATHSHLFLDKEAISNNFIVNKQGVYVEISQVCSMPEFHNLQFNLLGNSLESMLLPSSVIIVEGKTDKPYIEKIVRLKFPGSKILVIESQGNPKKAVHDLIRLTGDFARSPFRSRTFVVRDSVLHGTNNSEFVRLGILSDNIISWDRNGIEYVYPEQLIAAEFSCEPADIASFIISADEVFFQGITRRKCELSKNIISGMTNETELPDELVKKLLNPITKALGLTVT